MNPIKKITVIILVGLIFSFLFSAYSINKFDVYEISTDDKHYHSMIKGVKTNFNGDENLKVDVSISNCQ